MTRLALLMIIILTLAKMENSHIVMVVALIRKLGLIVASYLLLKLYSKRMQEIFNKENNAIYKARNLCWSGYEWMHIFSFKFEL